MDNDKSKAPKGTALAQGHKYESAACRYLEERGLVLVERNYRTPFGEIDLVMRDGDVLVFVEVRYRRGSGFGLPAESIDSRKQARLRATAARYLQALRAGEETPCRFDVVAISPDRGTQWLPNAFT